MSAITAQLRKHELEEYAEAFTAHAIDHVALTEADLREIGETQTTGQELLDGPPWQWPKR